MQQSYFLSFPKIKSLAWDVEYIEKQVFKVYFW